MLKTVFFKEQLQTDGCVMLLGGFDGLHVGHKKLLQRARAHGVPVGIMTIVGGKEEDCLFTFAEREEIFRSHGVDFVFELPFSEIKDFSPKAFVEVLKERFSPRAFVCGDDFRFGKGALGDAKTLQEIGQVCVEIEKLVTADGKKISTTTIKRHLKNGEVESANELLGEQFFLAGKVVQERGIGKTLGFPTANIPYPKEKFSIRKGVYETRVCVDGKEYKGITNHGDRPTFQEKSSTTETYLDGFNGTLYGRVLKVRFVRFLREIQKFDDAKQLQAQLQKDIGRVRGND